MTSVEVSPDDVGRGQPRHRVTGEMDPGQRVGHPPLLLLRRAVQLPAGHMLQQNQPCSATTSRPSAAGTGRPVTSPAAASSDAISHAAARSATRVADTRLATYVAPWGWTIQVWESIPAPCGLTSPPEIPQQLSWSLHGPTVPQDRPPTSGMAATA